MRPKIFATLLHPLYPSSPGLARGSTSLSWMAGPSPAMTSKKQRDNDLISRRVGWCGFALLRQERPLALHAPAIAGEIAVAPHDTMAWHDDGELVAGAGLRNRTHGSG